MEECPAKLRKRFPLHKYRYVLDKNSIDQLSSLGTSVRHKGRYD